MDIQKEFEKWSNSKVIAFGEELTWRNGQPTYEECWNACATLLANRVKDLEAEIKKLKEQIREQHKTVGILRENYNIACDEQDKEIREQIIKELREAREIIESCAKAYVLNDIGHLRGEQAGQFLAKLDLLERK